MIILPLLSETDTASKVAMYFRQHWIIILTIATAVGRAEPLPLTAFSIS